MNEITEITAEFPDGKKMSFKPQKGSTPEGNLKPEYAKNLIDGMSTQIEILVKEGAPDKCSLCDENKPDFLHAAYRHTVMLCGYICADCLPSIRNKHPYFNDYPDGVSTILISKILPSK